MRNRNSVYLALALIPATLACAAPLLRAPTQDTRAQLNLARTQAAIALTQTALAQPPATPDTPAPPTTGSIAGTLGFPSETIPPLTVYAIAVKDSSKYYFVTTAENQTQFTLDGLEAGDYFVVAYVQGAPSLAGAWSQFVPCGLSANCSDHSLIPVTVEAGKTTQGIEVKDWYAPPGTFPKQPE